LIVTGHKKENQARRGRLVKGSDDEEEEEVGLYAGDVGLYSYETGL